MPKLKPADYDISSKEELLAEIELRNSEGRNVEPEGKSIAKLIAALQADDTNGGEVSADDLKNKAIAAHDGVTAREVPKDLGDYQGQYKYLGEPKIAGEVWGLKIVPGSRHGKTHHAKSIARFGDYTEEEFRKQFDKL